MAALAAVTALTVSGCGSAVDGTAVAGADLGQHSSMIVEPSDDGYGVVLGTTEDAAIEIYIEPQCPHCASFFADYSDDLLEAIERDALSLTIRPVTFLDSGANDYSARASNAMFLVSEDEKASSALVMNFVGELYAMMLSATTAPSDDDIAQVANDAGVSADTVNRIAAGEAGVDALDMDISNMNQMTLIGATGTPTVYDLVTETDVDLTDPDWIDTVTAK